MKFDFETFIRFLISSDEINSYDKNKSRSFEYLKDLDSTYSLTRLDLLSDEILTTSIKKTAQRIRKEADVFLVIGIGGSYLGSKAVIEALSPYFYNEKNDFKIYFAGVSLSTEYLIDLITLIKDKSIYVNVISKSGTTTEIMITYNLIMKLMKEKYSEEELRERVIITTDKEKGVLKKEALKCGYQTFIIPDGIGGRFSVFTPVGLLPIAVAGINIDELFVGAKKASKELDKAFMYAVIRDIFMKKGKTVEAYVTYEPKLEFFLEWLKQLYGESLGKNGKGLLPTSLINTRDLHSLGQFVQDGNKILFETIINSIQSDENLFDDINKKSINEINQITIKAVSKAHQKGNVGSNLINIDKLNAENIGFLLQFFMLSCIISGYLSETNPFGQDGVEEYKKCVLEDLNK